MKNYIEQFYNEGFATIFYLKPINFLNKKLRNRKLVNLFSKIIKLLYTIIMIIFALFVFKYKWPL